MMPVSFQQQAGYEALPPEYVRAELANDDEVQFKKAGLEAADAVEAKAALDLEEAAEVGTTEAADDGGGSLSAYLAAPVTPAALDKDAPVTPDDSAEEQEGQGRMAAEEAEAEEGGMASAEVARFGEDLRNMYDTEAESDQVGTSSS
jgi:hypothetical protein